MGADAARWLSVDGYRVGILSSSGKGGALGESLGGFGVTDSNRSPESLGRLVDGALERWGRIDVLVDSAGHGPKGPVLEISDEDGHEGLEVHLLNVIRASRSVAPIVQGQAGGAIVNVSTFAAFEPDPLFPTSDVFRAGLASFAKLYADGVRMNNILPGFIDSLPATDERRECVPMGRYGRAEEVSSLISWLASEDGAYTTGQNLLIDAGLTRAV